jgi:hypothetical protein
MRPIQDSKVCPMGDPTWKEISFPVLQYLRGGRRSWPDLDGWAKEQRYGPGLLRQALAWLENVRSRYLPVENSKGTLRDRIFWESTSRLSKDHNSLLVPPQEQ